MNKFLGIFKSDLILPLILILAYLCFLVIARGTVPSSGELIATFTTLYAKYGLEIVFVAATLESLVIINFFVPGMVAMAMGAVFARSAHTDLTPLILVASVGLTIGYMTDYLLGLYGFSEIIKKLGYGNVLLKAKKSLQRFGTRGLILGFIYPNVGTYLSLVSGSVELGFKRFFFTAVVSTLTWVTLWAILIYAIGEIFLQILVKYSFLMVLVIIGGLFLLRIWNKEES